MRIAICINDQRFINELRNMINDLYNSIDLLIDSCAHGSQLLKSSLIKPYDIVFLDTDSHLMNSTALIHKILSISPGSSIVAMTSSLNSNNIPEGAVAYINKPLCSSDVRKTIDRITESMNRTKTIHLKTHDGEQCLRLSDILFIEAQDQNVIISTHQNSFSVRGHISDYETSLSEDGFFRIHRGYIVSLSKIARLAGKNVILEDNTSLPVSRSRCPKLKEMLFPVTNVKAF